LNRRNVEIIDAGMDTATIIVDRMLKRKINNIIDVKIIPSKILFNVSLTEALVNLELSLAIPNVNHLAKNF